MFYKIVNQKMFHNNDSTKAGTATRSVGIEVII